jgi:hypothetical protein
MLGSMTTLEELRQKADESEAQAARDKAALLDAAVAEAITTPEKYGHVSEVATRAGISSQYLRKLVDQRHPGVLDEASAKRKAAKAKRAK